METRRGFTLIELMIVVAIIAIIAAIALPSLLRSRVQTNEGAAIENLRSVSGAQFGYNAAKNQFGGFAALNSEIDGVGTAFLDSTWVEGREHQGYVFSMDKADATDFICYADPKQAGVTGVRWFRVDASGLIHWNSSSRPTTADPVIGTAE